MGTRSILALLALSLLTTGCGIEQSVPSSTSTSAPAGAWFIDVAENAGLDFVHFNGMSGEFYFPEIMSPGAGLLDYDNDGDLDVYLVQGSMLGRGRTLSQALLPSHGPLPPKGRLFRNDLRLQGDGTRMLRFTDVTDQSRIDARGYCIGVVAGDIDNDGWIDLYLTNFGPNQMLRNNGDGTFVDVSKRAGTDDAGWGVSGAFLDYDRDGWLDLYVGNYVHYTTETDISCPGLAPLITANTIAQIDMYARLRCRGISQRPIAAGSIAGSRRQPSRPVASVLARGLLR